MLKVGIIGYGNLGKAVEAVLEKNAKFKLIGVFSRRKLKNKHNAYLYKDAEKFINKIDVMIMCGGSEKDLFYQSKEMARFFNIIDTFDNHSVIPQHYENINKICKENKKSAILSCGWDPGFFSIMRTLYSSIFGYCECFYGKGISMGHTNAIKNVDGVKNAVQYTIPNKRAVKQAKQGTKINIPKHFRLCFVCSDKNKKEIKNQIKNIPNYFKGQPTFVKFISEKRIIKKQKNLAHKGSIYSSFIDKKEKISSCVSLKTTSNPILTAKIIMAYLTALEKMINNNYHQALTPIQIPVSWLIDQPDLNIIAQFC